MNKSLLGSLGISAALACLLGGCSGGSEKVGEGVVVVTDPDQVSGGKTASTESTTSASTPASEKSSRPSDSSPAPAAATASGWGTLKGRVIFEGDVPKLEPLVKQGSDVKDAAVCAKTDIPNEKLVVAPESRGVRWAIVFLPRPTAVNPEAESEAKAQVVEFDQQGCTFLPHALAVMKGAKVVVKSADQAGHNVHTQLRGTVFNQGIQPGSSVDVEIKNPDNRVGRVDCDIHPWMKAWWLTLNNPYFAVTNEKGEFEIKNVPAGEQKVVVWAEAVHPGFVTSSGSGDPVSIKADQTTTVDYKIDASKMK
jgi:plastocyanin